MTAATPQDAEVDNVYRFPAQPTSRHNLPASTVRMVGRDDLVSQLLQQVRQTRLVSIVGAGGMGKTTVALAVAERAREHYIDGVWFVDLAPLRNPALIAHAIANAASLAVHSAQALPALVRFLSRSRVLLVLDNCEQLIRAVACCVEQLLLQTPDLHIITTSRCALRVDGEQEIQLQGLASPPVSAGLTADAALRFPAIELFVDRASDRRSPFVLDDDDAPAVADICRNLDGIALAIELAAMRVDVFGVKDLSDQLKGRLRLLAGRRAGHERHRTLTATLDWSYRLLPERQARVLRALSVFAGSFRLTGAIEMADLPAAPLAWVLDELVSKSLLSVDAAPGGDKVYRLLVTTRLYCRDQRMALGEDAALRKRHASHVCQTLEHAARLAEQPPSQDWAVPYQSYLDDLRDALAWADADPSHHPLLVRLTAAGLWLWNHFSLTDESRGHLARAIERLSELDRLDGLDGLGRPDSPGGTGPASSTVEIQLQLALAGATLYTRGVTPPARAAVQRATELSQQSGDADLLLRCLRLDSTLKIFSGQHEAGMRTLETFMRIARTEDPSVLGEADTHLACAEILVGRPSSALERMQRLIADAPQPSHRAQLARFQYSNSVNRLIVLCHAQWLTGAPAAALQTASEVLRDGRLASHELSLSIGLAWNCLIYLWTGRDEACSQHTAWLEDLVEQHGILMWRPIADFCRGVLALRRAPGSEHGFEDIRRAIVAFRTTCHTARLPYYLAVQAELLADRSRLAEAEAILDEATAVAEAQNERWCVPELLRIRATTAAKQGRSDDAQQLLVCALQIAEDTEARSWALKACTTQMRLCLGGDGEAAARRQLQRILATFTEGVCTPDLAAAAALLTHGR